MRPSFLGARFPFQGSASSHDTGSGLDVAEVRPWGRAGLCVPRAGSSFLQSRLRLCSELLRRCNEPSYPQRCSHFPGNSLCLCPPSPHPASFRDTLVVPVLRAGMQASDRSWVGALGDPHVTRNVAETRRELWGLKRAGRAPPSCRVRGGKRQRAGPRGQAVEMGQGIWSEDRQPGGAAQGKPSVPGTGLLGRVTQARCGTGAPTHRSVRSGMSLLSPSSRVSCRTV